MTETGILKRAGILGTGSYVPAQVWTNDDLAQRLDTSDEWIASRTGIRERRIADPSQATSDLAVAAARKALDNAQVSPSEIDLVIVATGSPDYPGSFPSTASVVQNALGCAGAGAFDLGSVCAGFSYALHVGAQMVRSGANRRVLIIGAETFSRIINWNDRATAVLFGDGAGAVVVGETSQEGYLGGVLGADGSGGPLLQVAAGGSRNPLRAENMGSDEATVFQNGREVYKFAVKIMGEAAASAVKAAGLQPEDVDLLIPHQANIRIIQKAAERMGLSMDKVFVNVERYGNTSAASIPLALDEAAQQGRIKYGDIAALVGFGAGLSWGANVIRWLRE